MKIITINLPQKYSDAIQTLQDLRIYPSRSEAIREALRRFLRKEFVFMEEIDDDSFSMLMRSGSQ